MATYKTTGIVLRRAEFRENDRLFVIYTRDFGKIQAVARGARKIKSKLASHLEPFSLSELMVARGQNYDHLASAILKNNFFNIKSDLDRTLLINYCLEAVDQLTKYQYPDRQIFDLLSQILELLNSNSKNNYPSPFHEKGEGLRPLIAIFMLKLLTLLGYKPELFYCLICRKKVEPHDNYFSADKGGLICRDCGKNPPLIPPFSKGDKGGFLPISTDTIKIFRLMLSRDLKDFLKIKTESQLYQEMNEIIDAFLEQHLDQELKSKRCLLKI